MVRRRAESLSSRTWLTLAATAHAVIQCGFTALCYNTQRISAHRSFMSAHTMFLSSDCISLPLISDPAQERTVHQSSLSFFSSYLLALT